MQFTFHLHPFHVQSPGIGLQSPEATTSLVSLASPPAPLPSPSHSVPECWPPCCSPNPSDSLWPRAFELVLSYAWNVLFYFIHLAHSLTTSNPCCNFSSLRPLLTALFNIANHTFAFTPQLSWSFFPSPLLNFCPFLHNSNDLLTNYVVYSFMMQRVYILSASAGM